MPGLQNQVEQLRRKELEKMEKLKKNSYLTGTHYTHR